MLRPSNVGTVIYYWWFDNKTDVSLHFSFSTRLTVYSRREKFANQKSDLCLSLCLQPVVTLDGAMSYTFSKEGRHSVTVQAAVGNTVHQDQMTVAVYGEPYILISPRSSHFNRLLMQHRRINRIQAYFYFFRAFSWFTFICRFFNWDGFDWYLDYVIPSDYV